MADFSTRGPGDLPGSLRGLQPVLQSGPHARLVGPEVWSGEVQARRTPADRAGPTHGWLAPGGNAWALSASTIWWPTAADHGRSGAAAEATHHHRRRAGVDGRRVAARDHPREPAQVVYRPGHLVGLHHPRFDHGIS